MNHLYKFILFPLISMFFFLFLQFLNVWICCVSAAACCLIPDRTMTFPNCQMKVSYIQPWKNKQLKINLFHLLHNNISVKAFWVEKRQCSIIWLFFGLFVQGVHLQAVQRNRMAAQSVSQKPARTLKSRCKLNTSEQMHTCQVEKYPALQLFVCVLMQQLEHLCFP